MPEPDISHFFRNTHHPPHTQGAPRGVALIAHGFKGYKDYGFLPRLADALAAAGFTAHRFNFSGSGMTDDTETFARPDRFEQDTWNRQVADLHTLHAALRQPGLPMLWFGHSRGGDTALLAAQRLPADQRPDAVVTAAAPADCNRLSAADQQRLLDDGFLVSPSGRTGQDLRIGRAWLQEQLDDPAAHDPVAAAAELGSAGVDLTVIHGDADPTVPVTDGQRLAEAAGVPLHRIPDADHVFNAPNPMPPGTTPEPRTEELFNLCTQAAEGLMR